MDLLKERGPLFLQKLRKITQPMHAGLEEIELIGNLMKPSVSIEEYVDYLRHMKSVIFYHENITFPLIADLFPDIKSRQKLSLINDDLEFLKLHGKKSKLSEYEIQSDLSFNVPRALGYMYVIEGSTLGGQIILKHINKVFGFNEQKGGSFFSGYGNSTGKLWKDFLTVFINYGITENCEDEIIAGAINAFSSIQIHFTQPNENKRYSKP